MNTGVRKYQALTKAAKAVADGKPGAKAKLAKAKKDYVTHVKTTAAADLQKKVKEAEKRAAKIAGVKPASKSAKAKPASKRKPVVKKKASTGRKTTRRR